MPSRWERLRRTFSLDLRSLALLRILLGFMLVLDLALRAQDLSLHYSDFGLVTREMELSSGLRAHPWRFSLHMLSGNLTFQLLLFFIAGAFSVALLLGFHTKLALLGSLVFFLSVLNRNGQVATGIDAILRLVCLWCLFLPLGHRFSLDRKAGRVRESSSGGGDDDENRFFSPASVALILQMFAIYFFSALHKDHAVWRTDFTAVQYALHIDSFDTTLGTLLRDFPTVTKAMTRGTMVLEFFFPWLLFGAGILSLLPRLEHLFEEQDRLRTAAVLSFMLFHFGLGLTIALGTFPWFVILIWFGLLPSAVWNFLEERLGEHSKEQPKLPLARFCFEGWRRARTFILASEAPLVGTSPRSGFAPVRLFRWAQQALVVFLLLLVSCINLGTLDERFSRFISGRGAISLDLRAWVDALRLDQHWGLFAPRPRTVDGYYVLEAEKSDGTKIDLLREDNKLTWEKPDDVSASYGTIRSAKLHRNLRSSSKSALRKRYIALACRRYEKEHPSEPALKKVTLYFMSRKTLKAGGYAPTQKQKLQQASCTPRRPGPRAS